jgi:AcrR family transcriptional regulator
MPKDTRDKILDAGLRLFSKKGYLGATTKEIAKKAGVAELTLFRHFTSKERLFGEMIERYSFLPALRELLPGIRDMEYRDALSAIAKKYLERLSERRDLIKIMLTEMHVYPSKVRVIYYNFVDELVKTLASYFGDMQKMGVVRDFDPEVAARAFFGMFFSYFNSQEIMMLKKYGAANTETIIREYVKIFVTGTLQKGAEQ